MILTWFVKNSQNVLCVITMNSEYRTIRSFIIISNVLGSSVIAKVIVLLELNRHVHYFCFL